MLDNPHTNFDSAFHKVSKAVFHILAISLEDTEEYLHILAGSKNLEKKANGNLLRYHTDFFAFCKRYHNEDISVEISMNAQSEWQVNFLQSAENARIIALAHADHKYMSGITNNLKGYAKTLKDDILYYFLNQLNFTLPTSFFRDRNEINYDYDFTDLHGYIRSQRDFLTLILDTINLKNRDLHDNTSHTDDTITDENITPNTYDSDHNNHNNDSTANNNNNQPTHTPPLEKKSQGISTLNHYDSENNIDPMDTHTTDINHKIHSRPTYESQKYFAHTKKYDQEIMAMDLQSFQGEALNLRKKLDTELNNTTNSNINILALRLQRKLQAKNYTNRHDNLSYGTLDTKKLYKAITSPLAPNVYYQETTQDQINTTVTILVDNSGSQMGNAITTSCISCDLLAKIFERCNISCEILGFTTKNWQGGLSFKDWQNHIKRNPHKLQESNNGGRLNDLLHIIYKPANKKYNLTKNSMAMMLKRGILKENIDGEALEWAYERICKRSEQRKIILVISDGTPADDITQTYNDKNYLLDHLKTVIQTINNDNSLELLAIGMGFDIQNIYKNSINIKDYTNLGPTIMNLFLKNL